MTTDRVNVLMVTYRSSGYLRLSLDHLLAALSDDDRIWLWHNGDDEQTLDVLADYRDHPLVGRFHHSRENVRLGPPMRWLWTESTARYLSKVDDDCLVEERWLDTLLPALEANPEWGVLGSWRHPDEDFDAELSAPKMATLRGHDILRNPWVQGSGFVVGRPWLDRSGPIRDGETFTQFCVRLATLGAVNGWYHPFVREDHMDDPRSPHTMIRTDADLRDRMPLSAERLGVVTVDDWVQQLRRSAHVIQAASLDPRAHTGWRNRVRVAERRLRRLLGRPARW